MALTYAIDERLADTASVCVLFAQTEKVDLSHLRLTTVAPAPCTA